MQLVDASLIAGLNAQQREAVLETEGPVLIVAGAGSCKTRVISHRIAHLIRNVGIRPEQILAVTFTNKAAREMRQRVYLLAGSDARGAWICTFHAMCVRILRSDIDRLGYDPAFSIYDDNDQTAIVKESIAPLGKKAKAPGYYRSVIGRFKNQLLTPDAVAAQAETSHDRQLAQLYRLNQRKLREQNALDFDDLLLLTIRLFDEHPGILDVYQERFRYIMVDEYQDTNHLQYALIRRLAAKYRNLCVVGDDYQSIYSFRLADISNILSFQQDYPDARVFKLEQNYRSTQTILEAAGHVIAHNENQIKKRLWTENGSGEAVQICRCPTDRHEAQWVANEILFLQREYRLSDIAVLYRTNAQSRMIEEECIKNRIPYRLIGGLRFYDRKEVRDILAYLRLIHNPKDSLSLQRIINTPRRGIGAKTLQAYARYANDNELSLFEALCNSEACGVTGRAAVAMDRFTDLVEYYHERQDEMTVVDLIKAILNRFDYKSVYDGNKEKDQERLENIDELIRVADEFDRRQGEDATLKGFLDNVALLTELDRDDDDADMVTLMTVHASKGLEFPVVFMIGMEESLFPHFRSADTLFGVEEERRLCYVGMTRARERLILTHAESRMVAGKPSESFPSRFLDEIPPELAEELEYY